MWIEIDESLVDLYPSANVSQCAALESVALSVFHGKNFLYARKRTLDWMCDQDLSGAAKSVCSRLKNRLPEYSSLRDFIKVKIIIVSSEKEFGFSKLGFWELPLSALEDHPVSSCTLLAENLTDANIYLVAAEHYKKHLKINGLTTNITTSGGGGNQIYPSFVNFINQRNTYCLSVTDTDKDYPNAEPNVTSKNCRDIATTRQWIADHINVPGRELENILPINIVEDAIFSDSGAADLHTRFNKIKSAVKNQNTALLYCDLKMGTKYSWTSKNHGNHEKMNFWREFLNQKKLPISGCENDCGEQCNCFMIEALGEKVAEKFLDFCKQNSIHKQYERMKTSSNADQWLEIGKAVFDWGVAIPKSRS